jgi:hypothetical protein
MSEKLQGIKNRVENQIIYIEGYIGEIRFEEEVNWLIQTVEKYENALEELKTKNTYWYNVIEDLLQQNES